MPVTYSWHFPTLEAKPSADGLANVVSVVHWRLAATDGEHTAEIYGTVALDDPAPGHFVAFDALTPAIVEGWVASKMDDLDARKASLAGELAAMATPPVVSLAPPWAA